MVQLCSTSFSSSRLSYMCFADLQHIFCPTVFIGLIPVLVKPHSQMVRFPLITKKTTQNSQSNSIGWKFQILGLKSQFLLSRHWSLALCALFRSLCASFKLFRSASWVWRRRRRLGRFSVFGAVFASILTHEDPKEKDVVGWCDSFEVMIFRIDPTCWWCFHY